MTPVFIRISPVKLHRQARVLDAWGEQRMDEIAHPAHSEGVYIADAFDMFIVDTAATTQYFKYFTPYGARSWLVN